MEKRKERKKMRNGEEKGKEDEKRGRESREEKIVWNEGEKRRERAVKLT